MDREHHRQQRQQRQSSLPSSLIPHLFSGPQQPRYSQTRTTLQSEDGLSTPFPHDRDPSTQTSLSSSFDHHRSQFPPPHLSSVDTRDRHLDRRLPHLPSTPPHRVLDPSSSSFSHQYGGPTYSDPIFHSGTQSSMSPRSQTYSLPPINPGSRHVLQPLDTWREGEPGPSSLLRPASHDEAAFSRLRRGLNEPLRVDSRSSGAHRSQSPVFEYGPPVQEQFRHRGERDAYISSSDHSWPGDYHSVPSFERLPGPAQLFERSPERQSPSYEQSQERPDLYSFPAVGSLSISAPSASYVRRRSSDTGSLHRSEVRSADVGSNDGESSQRGKRRRAESVDADDTVKKMRNPRKTAVACNFCRGRKLRCNGEKPSCYNCTVRKYECQYVPVQRRRGPGKAPKGSRSKRGGRMDAKAGDRGSAAVMEHELDSLAPEVRPYMSVLSLKSFEFQPPSPSPRYPSGLGSSAQGRRSRSRETSSEDRSDGEKE